MAYKSGKRSYRSKRVSKRRYTRRKRMVSKVPRSLTSGAVVNVKREFWYTTFTPSTASTTLFCPYWNVSLAALPDYTKYTNLFDLYKFNGFKLTFRPRFTMGTQAAQAVPISSSTNYQQWVTVCTDPAQIQPTGVYGSATLNTLMSTGKSKTHNGNRVFSVYTKAYSLATSATDGVLSEPVRGKWTRTSDYAQAYYGVYTYFWDNMFDSTMLSQGAYDIFVTAYIQFKNPKGF